MSSRLKLDDRMKFQFWYLVFIVIYAYLLVVDHRQVCAINSSSSIVLLEIYCFLFVVGTLPTELLQVIILNLSFEFLFLSRKFYQFSMVPYRSKHGAYIVFSLFMYFMMYL